MLTTFTLLVVTGGASFGLPWAGGLHRRYQLDLSVPTGPRRGPRDAGGTA